MDIGSPDAGLLAALGELFREDGGRGICSDRHMCLQRAGEVETEIYKFESILCLIV